MGRLIDADKLKAYLQDKYVMYDHTLADIDVQPTVDAVPTEFHNKCMEIEIQKRFDLELNSERVIRCKDCIYYDMEHNWCTYWEEMGMQLTDFCSKAERKEDAN